MKITPVIVLLLSLSVLLGGRTPGQALAWALDAEKTDAKTYQKIVQPFFKAYCIQCHGPDVQKAKFKLHDIDFRIADGKDLDRWEKALELIDLGDMPPQKKGVAQPGKAQKQQVIQWIQAELKKIGRGHTDAGLAMPAQGNRVKHEELFSGKHKGPAYSRPRLWRKSPKIYQTLGYGTQPFVGIGGHGFQDYALLIADEAPISAMLRNSYQLADRLMRDDHRSNPLREYIKFKGKSLTPEQEKVLIDRVFLMLFNRTPGDQDKKYIEGLYKKNKPHGGWEGGLESLVVGILLSPEYVFRMEMGLGKKLDDGRRMLSPREIAYALSFALSDTPDKNLIQLAKTGKLSTKKDVEREARKLLYQPLDKRKFGYGMLHHKYNPDGYANPRVIRFFQEFFGYLPALDVFKEKARFDGHYARNLVMDADYLILNLLDKDKDVIEQLLTTNVYFTKPFDEKMVKRFAEPDINDRQYQYIHKNHKHVAEIAKTGKLPAFISLGGNGFSGPMTVSPSYLPIEVLKKMNRAPGGDLVLPKQQRAGILTHPAWLVAHSYNTDNNLVARGKWVREYLLAGLIPEVPLGVEAKVPDEPHKTLKEKFEIVKPDECWRCHKKMNPLANAFEAYDDFGRYRTEIPIGDVPAYEQAHYEYRQKKRGYQRKIGGLERKTPQAIAKQIEDLQQRIADKPKPGDDKFEQALKKYEKQLPGWHKQLKGLKNYDHDKRLKEIKKFRQLLAGLIEPKPRTKPVDAGGSLDGTGDPDLDGPYNTPRELMERLAKSQRVRQSIVRHAFRYWMGRNEKLHDSPTLMAAEKAYLDSGGSFKEVIISLLTSDSFLYRK